MAVGNIDLSRVNISLTEFQLQVNWRRHGAANVL